MCFRASSFAKDTDKTKIIAVRIQCIWDYLHYLLILEEFRVVGGRREGGGGGGGGFGS